MTKQENRYKQSWLFKTNNNQYWYQTKDGDPFAMELYQRHYSARHYKDNRNVKLFCGPGEKIVLLTENKDALLIWKKFMDNSDQRGVNCSIFRNESDILSSLLIIEAMKYANKKWPEERMYTYVNSKKIKSTNPGYCFLCAGWKVCGITKGGLIILEFLI
jgi:hypothetical protein